MQVLGNTKTFFDTQATIQDTDVNEYLNKTIEDNYGVLFDMAQGQTMEDMINAQYWYSGMKVTGGKVFAIFTLLGALGGAA